MRGFKFHACLRIHYRLNSTEERDGRGLISESKHRNFFLHIVHVKKLHQVPSPNDFPSKTSAELAKSVGHKSITIDSLDQMNFQSQHILCGQAPQGCCRVSQGSLGSPSSSGINSSSAYTPGSGSDGHCVLRHGNRAPCAPPSCLWVGCRTQNQGVASKVSLLPTPGSSQGSEPELRCSVFLIFPQWRFYTFICSMDRALTRTIFSCVVYGSVIDK